METGVSFTIFPQADVSKYVGVLAHTGLHLEDIHTRGAAGEEALGGLNNLLLLVRVCSPLLNRWQIEVVRPSDMT